MYAQKKINKDFFKVWSPEMAYVLGFFAADGYITVNKRGGQYWCIQITDKKLLYSIKKSLNSEHRISVRFPKKENESVKYRIQVGSIEMCNDLRKLGFFERKTKSLAIPNIPKKHFSHFVRGYFDGDGNIWRGEVHKERKTRHEVLLMVFTSCSHEFLANLYHRLSILDIKGGSLYRSKKKEFSRLQYSTKDALKLYKFMYNGMNTSELFLERKKCVFESYIALRL